MGKEEENKIYDDIPKIPKPSECDDYLARLKALELLKKQKDPSAVELLIQALKDTHNQVRREAVKILGEFQDIRSLYPLIDLIDDDADEVRKEVVIALKSLGNQILHLLLLELQKRDSNPKIKAIEVLGKLGNQQAVDPLLKELVYNHHKTTSCVNLTHAMRDHHAQQ